MDDDDDTIDTNMEVTILLEDQSTLCIEVSLFDSFKEIKEKIEKFTNIPVHKQTLIFNGQVLQNETHMSATNIWGDIPIKLLVASDSSTHELHQNSEPPIQEFHSIPMPAFPPPSLNELQEMTTPIGPILDEFLNEMDQTTSQPLPQNLHVLTQFLFSETPPQTLNQTPVTPQTTSTTPPLFPEDFDELMPLSDPEMMQPTLSHTPVTPQTTSTMPLLPEDLDELMEFSYSETLPPTLNHTPVTLEKTSPVAPLPEDFPVMNTQSPPPNRNEFEEFEINVDEFMELFSDTPASTFDQMPIATPQTISPAAPLIVEVDTPSPPQNINDFLEDSEKFLESMMDMTMPTKDKFEELFRKHTETPETASPAPLLPRLLNFDDAEASPSPPPPTRSRVKLTVKILETKMKPFKIEMDPDDTVSQLKEKIYKKKRRRTIAPSEMSVRLKPDQDLNDQLKLRDCGMLTISNVSVRKKSPKLPNAPSLSHHSNSPLPPQRISPVVATDNLNSPLHPQRISPAAAAADSSKSRLHPQQISPASAAADSSMSRLHPQRISPVVATDNSNSPLHPQRISPAAAAADSSKSRLHPQRISPAAAADTSISRLHRQRIVPAAENSNSRLNPQRIFSAAYNSKSRLEHEQLISPVAAADPVLGVKMLNLFVVPKGGSEKIPIKINAYNKIEKLRDELEKFHKHILPQKGRYFFTLQNKGFVMTETYVFNWYRLEDGETIEITPECGPPKLNRKKWTIPSSSSSSTQL